MKTGLGLTYAFKHYYLTNKDIKKKINLDTFLKVNYDFNKEISKKILEGYEFMMPFGMGRLHILKFKKQIKFNDDGSVNKQKLRVDWSKTIRNIMNKTGKSWKEAKASLVGAKLLYHFNSHTDGWTVRWHWEKVISYINNISLYKMSPAKDNRLKLATLIKNNLAILDKYTLQIVTIKKNANT